ncbi:MAG: diacylglycerol kinase family protein [Geobacteraceae bacterium]|nr:diacylglycerol kinase family protein [Geobacteraceae bacterium]
METYLFINPCSGRYDQSRISTVIQRLNESGFSPIVCTLTPPEHGPSVFQTINSSTERPLVIVAAGDGTINAVVNGLEPHSATLAILPLGTSNVLAAEIGIHSVEDGIGRIVAGKTQSFSVGVLELKQVSRRFVLMVGIGFDGTVVRDVWLPGKRFLKQGAYAIAAILSCLRWDRSLIEISTAEHRITCHSVIICNASRYGGSFRIAPGCSVFSPGLTAICIQKNSRRTYLQLALELVRGRIASSRAILRIPADGCEIRGIKPLQIDGDFIGYSPGRLMTVADFARIIV